MVGKFLLGMMSGSLLVAGGLVVGSAIAPPKRPAAEPASAAAPVTAPDPVTPEAGATSASDAAPADSTLPDPDPVAENGLPKAAPDNETASGTEAATEDATEAATEIDVAATPKPEPMPPAVALAEAAPEAPVDPGPESAALVAPAATAVPAPETALAPDRPAGMAADAVATPDLATPDPMPDPMPERVDEPRLLAEADAALATETPETADIAENASSPEAGPEPEPTLPVVADAAPEPAPALPTPALAVEPLSPDVDEAAPAPEVALAPETAPGGQPDATPEIAAVIPPDLATEDPAPEAEAATLPAAAAEALPETREAATDLPVAEATPAPSALPVTPATPEAGIEEAATGLPGDPPEAMPGTPAMPEIAEADSGASTFVPAPRLVRRSEGLIIRRGNEEETPAQSPDPANDPAADAATPPEDLRPIARFAASFDNPAAKPSLSIVLVDTGAPDLDRAGLAALPFPVSFALDPLDPATADRAAIYRAAGREVVMLVTGIAEGARPSDVEVAFQSMEQGLPEAVAAMDLAAPTFQSNRGLAGAVVPILKASGRGLLTWEVGLNAADQVARREDVEAAVVFRDLDTAGTERAALRRLLDRAVFKAGQDGRATVVGTASPELAAALLEWTIEGKAATVALAPVTATLRVD